VLENLALRHQLVVLQRAVRRPRLRTADRLFWVLLSHLWRGWAAALSVVQPATVIRWQRAGFTLFWAWKSRRNGPGHRTVHGVMERFMRTLKEQCLYLHRFQTLEEARRMIAAFIDRYNHEWLIERLGYRTPAEARTEDWRAAA
jgi:transposase InsO family protein